MNPPDAHQATSRSLALSGVVFAVLFLIGWFVSGGDAPDADERSGPSVVARNRRA